MGHTRNTRIFLILCIGAVIVSCDTSGADDQSSTSGQSVTTTTTTTTTTTVQAATYHYSFTNNSDEALTIDPYSAGDFTSFTIAPGQTEVISSTRVVISQIIVEQPSGTSKTYDYTFGNSIYSFLLIDYLYLIQYTVTGTASAVDVTLSNATGGTEQYSNVSLPVTYSYPTFSNSFHYISAQNDGATGSVTTSIYYKGQLYKTSTSSGAYVIATASY